MWKRFSDAQGGKQQKVHRLHHINVIRIPSIAAFYGSPIVQDKRLNFLVMFLKEKYFKIRQLKRKL